jgi:hypothetical protein
LTIAMVRCPSFDADSPCTRSELPLPPADSCHVWGYLTLTPVEVKPG